MGDGSDNAYLEQRARMDCPSRIDHRLTITLASRLQTWMGLSGIICQGVEGVLQASCRRRRIESVLHVMSGEMCIDFDFTPLIIGVLGSAVPDNVSGFVHQSRLNLIWILPRRGGVGPHATPSQRTLMPNLRSSWPGLDLLLGRNSNDRENNEGEDSSFNDDAGTRPRYQGGGGRGRYDRDRDGEGRGYQGRGGYRGNGGAPGKSWAARARRGVGKNTLARYLVNFYPGKLH